MSVVDLTYVQLFLQLLSICKTIKPNRLVNIHNYEEKQMITVQFEDTKLVVSGVTDVHFWEKLIKVFESLAASFDVKVLIRTSNWIQFRSIDINDLKSLVQKRWLVRIIKLINDEYKLNPSNSHTEDESIAYLDIITSLIYLCEIEMQLKRRHFPFPDDYDQIFNMPKEGYKL